VLSRFRADWRRGRALKQLRLGERQFWDWDSKTEAGVIRGEMIFSADGDTLVLFFRNIYARDVEEKGEYQAPLGLNGVRGFLEICAQLGADAGFTRMRVEGQRTTRHYKRGESQRFEFDLARFLRGAGAAR
jgi:hypothetical protein